MIAFKWFKKRLYLKACFEKFESCRNVGSQDNDHPEILHPDSSIAGILLASYHIISL